MDENAEIVPEVEVATTEEVKKEEEVPETVEGASAPSVEETA